MKFKQMFHNVIVAATPSSRRERRTSDFQLLDAFDSQNNKGLGRSGGRERGSSQQVGGVRPTRRYQPPIELQSMREESESEVGVVERKDGESEELFPGPFHVYRPTSERISMDNLESDSNRFSFSNVRLALREVVGEDDPMPVSRGSSDEDEDVSGISNKSQPSETTPRLSSFCCCCICLSKKWKFRVKIIGAIIVLVICILLTMLVMSLRGMNGYVPHHHENEHEDPNLGVLRRQQWPLHDAQSRKLNISFDTMARAHKIWNFDKDDDDSDENAKGSQKLAQESSSNNETKLQPTINGVAVSSQVLQESYELARSILKGKLNENSSELSVLLWKGLANAVAIAQIVEKSLNSTGSTNISLSGDLPPDLCYSKNESLNYNFKDVDLVCNRSEKYRSINGTCNNVIHRGWGAQYVPLRLIISNDIISALKGMPVTSQNETDLTPPSSELVSQKAHGGASTPDSKTSALFPFWGMLILHDTVKVADSAINCCDYNEHAVIDPLTNKLHHNNDALCSRKSVQMFSRRPFPQLSENHRLLVENTCSYFPHPAMYPSCEIDKPRTSFNLVTSYIDASNVYGSSEETLNKLRTMEEGKLKVKPAKRTPTINLPFLLQAKEQNESCFQGNPINADIRNCSLAGDADVNEMAVLTTLNTILMRQHNWIARFLHHHNSHWNDERIFQETRHILIAQIQHITYNEFLPELFGKELMKIGGLDLEDEEFYEVYDSVVDASVSDAFAGAAGYFWLSMINGRAKSIWGKAKMTQETEFGINKLYYMPNYLTIHEKNLEALVLGFTSAKSNKVGVEISPLMHSLRIHSANKTLDFVKMIIQKGRDLNLVPYIEWRKVCGFPAIESLHDLKDIWYPAAYQNASRAFKHVRHIDLFTGMLAEKPIKGARVGPTLACLLMDQFLRLKKGDRFWYEGDVYMHHFSIEQLQEIRKTTLARIICDNTNGDLLEIPRWPLLIVNSDNSYFNPTVQCKDSRIPKLNFRLWKEKVNKIKSSIEEDSEDEYYSSDSKSREEQDQTVELNAKN